MRRALVAALGCLSVAALHSALAADPPPAPAASTTDASASVQTPAAPATPAKDASASMQAPAPTAPSTTTAATAPAAKPATDSDDAQLERSLHAKGYTMRMQNGEKVYCRREDVIGSRLGGALHCMTLDEARVNEERARLDAERMQRVVAPCIATGTRGVNCGN
jgi:hypothetical protein